MARPSDVARRWFRQARLAGRGRASRVLPWLGTAVLLAWIFATTDLPALLAALGRANWPLFLGGTAGLYLLIWMVDAFSAGWLYRRFHLPNLRLGDLLAPRAATYLPGIVNYAAGNAALVLFLRQRYGTPVGAASASMLLLMLVDAGLLVWCAAAGSVYLPAGWQTPLVTLAVVGTLGGALHLVYWRTPGRWRRLEALRVVPALAVFRTATLRDYLVLGTLRLPTIGLYVAIHLVTLRAFGIVIPLGELAAYVPLQMVVAALPISVAGLGTVGAAQRVLYAPWVEADAAGVPTSAAIAMVDAYALALFGAFLLPRLLLGLAGLPATLRALQQPPVSPRLGPSRAADDDVGTPPPTSGSDGPSD